MNIIKSVMPAPTYDYIAHPLANMFPMIQGQEFENLKTSIAKSGILEPIRLFQGLILDGRNRYAAAKACGHQFTAKDFKNGSAHSKKRRSGSSKLTSTVATSQLSRNKRWCESGSKSVRVCQIDRSPSN